MSSPVTETRAGGKASLHTNSSTSPKLLFVTILIVILYSDDTAVASRSLPQLPSSSPELGTKDCPSRVGGTNVPNLDLGSRSGRRERERRVWREAHRENLALFHQKEQKRDKRNNGQRLIPLIRIALAIPTYDTQIPANGQRNFSLPAIFLVDIPHLDSAIHTTSSDTPSDVRVDIQSGGRTVVCRNGVLWLRNRSGPLLSGGGKGSCIVRQDQSVLERHLNVSSAFVSQPRLNGVVNPQHDLQRSPCRSTGPT